ncbi:MAG: hypothetical protein JO291_04785 [Acidimicrobiia bacterium]|nr:hypothetical protein [Acidimicrobiia bacterium]
MPEFALPEFGRRGFLIGTATAGALLVSGIGLAGCSPPDITVPELGVAGTGTLSSTDLASLLSTLDVTDHAHTGIVRLNIEWDQIEKVSGSPTWGNTDDKVGAALDAGLEVLAVISFTPDWARPAGTDHTRAPTVPLYYARFCQYFVTRYPDVKFVEVWNEANSRGFWTTATGTDPIDAYAEMLGLAYNAIKNTSQGQVSVGTSGTAPNPTSGSLPADFLQGVLTYAGDNYTQNPDYGWAAVPFDFVCHHPYNWSRNDSANGPYKQVDGNSPTNGFALRTAELNEVLQSVPSADGGPITNMRIWATESGVPWDPDAVTGQGLLIPSHQTTLTSSTGTGAGSFTVQSGSALPAAPTNRKIFVRIGSETLRVSRSGNTLTVAVAGDRGMFGTAAVNHTSGTVTLIAPHVASPTEAYTYVTEMFGYWRAQTGYTTWPQVTGGPTIDASEVCGPIFLFGIVDFLDTGAANGSAGFVADAESYYGLFDNGLVRKRVTGNDAYDAYVAQPGGTQSMPAARRTRTRT